MATLMTLVESKLYLWQHRIARALLTSFSNQSGLVEYGVYFCGPITEKFWKGIVHHGEYTGMLNRLYVM